MVSGGGGRGGGWGAGEEVGERIGDAVHVGELFVGGKGFGGGIGRGGGELVGGVLGGEDVGWGGGVGRGFCGGGGFAEECVEAVGHAFDLLDFAAFDGAELEDFAVGGGEDRARVWVHGAEAGF